MNSKFFTKAILAGTGSEVISIKVKNKSINVYNHGDVYVDIPLQELAEVLQDVELQVIARLQHQDELEFAQIINDLGFLPAQ